MTRVSTIVSKEMVSLSLQKNSQRWLTLRKRGNKALEDLSGLSRITIASYQSSM